jgi:soluble lytic murein transglycosylase
MVSQRRALATLAGLVRLSGVLALLSIGDLWLSCAKSSLPAGVASGGRAMSSAPPSALLSSRALGSAEPPERVERASAGWVEAARLDQWDEAARLIDGLDLATQNSASLRFLRARAALALRDFGRAAKLLDQLESLLPLLASEIAEDRATARLEVGPYAEAAGFFSARDTAEALTQAALGWERAGELERALGLASRAVERASRARTSQVGARAIRARLAEKLGRRTLALGDWRWLATTAPTSPVAEEAAQRLETSAPLTRAERSTRALAFARAGDVVRAEGELEIGAPGAPLSPARRRHFRGWIRYLARTDYLEAAEMLEQAAQSRGEDQVRDLFYAARARSRAHDDQAAIRLYLRLVTRYPKSPYAEEARYLAARLTYASGHWKQASQAYSTYLGRYGRRGRFAESAEYELATTWLAAKQGRLSVKAWQKLLAQTEDASLRVRYRELYGVAWLIAGHPDLARREFSQVVHEAPLSLPALVSLLRLRDLGEPTPRVPAEPDTPGPPLEIELPPKVRLLHELGLDGDAERALSAQAAELRRTHGARADEALCAAYGRLAAGAERLGAGQRALKGSVLERAPSNTTRWLWNCVYPRPYPALVRSSETEYSLPPGLIHALMRQESGFRPEVESDVGAVGLMQLLPSTAAKVAAELGLPLSTSELGRPWLNLRLGSFYLARLFRKFQGNVPLAVAAYNAGPRSVAHWLKGGESLPLDVFVARIPFAETRGYVYRVLANLARYAYLDGGPEALPQLSLQLPQGIRASAEDY